MTKITHLVVDSGAFIKSAPVHEYAENIYTVKGAVHEIKDKATVQRLQFLPYTLEVKEPTPDALKYVSDFSRKTGDFANLSLVDLQILALTYQLEKENVGTEHLNKAPSCQVTGKPAFEDTKLCGFYFPKEKKDKTSISDSNNDITSEKDSNSDQAADSKTSNLKDQPHQNGDAESSGEDEYEDAVSSEESEESFEDAQDDNEEDYSADSEDDSDEGAWITPHNIAKVEKQMGGLTLEPTAQVACITTDFCIQNVLIQMGLHVLSVDGMQIKHARVFILRCHSCFKTTSNMSKKFCPSCGNQTLKRVAVTVNDDGTKTVHVNFRRPINIRGKRFSLPTPQGGKHGINPIVCEDQPIPQNRPSKRALKKIDALSEDYVVQASPFAQNDIYTRAGQLGIRSNNRSHFGKRNPNQNSKRTGNKKK